MPEMIRAQSSLKWIRFFQKVAAYELPKFGFLNKKLEMTLDESADVITFVHDGLTDRAVVSVLDSLVIAEITQAKRSKHGYCPLTVKSLSFTVILLIRQYFVR
jgi:hypothetical protein